MKNKLTKNHFSVLWLAVRYIYLPASEVYFGDLLIASVPPFPEAYVRHLRIRDSSVRSFSQMCNHAAAGVTNKFLFKQKESSNLQMQDTTNGIHALLMLILKQLRSPNLCSYQNNSHQVLKVLGSSMSPFGSVLLFDKNSRQIVCNYGRVQHSVCRTLERVILYCILHTNINKRLDTK